jgi:hypothetical protein
VSLDGQFLRPTFVNTMRTRRFEGHAYYRALGNALVATWGTTDTEVGETTYRLQPTSAMEIVDRLRGKDGRLRDFGRVPVKRR